MVVVVQAFELAERLRDGLVHDKGEKNIWWRSGARLACGDCIAPFQIARGTSGKVQPPDANISAMLARKGGAHYHHGDLEQLLVG